MRLTCPNCGAQYEVPDEVIPTSGRDVQCSNCGDTWFQHHADHIPDPEDDETESWDASPETDDFDDEPEDEPEDPPEHDTPENSLDDAPDKEPRDDTAPRRSELDPTVAGVLREEAERERAARALENTGGLETQPELGLNGGVDDADKRSAEAEARMARLRGEPEQAPPPNDIDDGPSAGTRRSLLPDIDEINSSLSSDGTSAGRPIDDAEADNIASARGAGFAAASGRSSCWPCWG